MSRLKLAFTDFPGHFNVLRIQNLLQTRFDIEIDEDNPDYVIFSVFGHKYLRYSEAIRIFFTGENVHPDFNLCDYAFGYDWLDFGDRFYRCPNYALYDQFKDICKRGRTIITQEYLRKHKQNFCNFIYSNSDAHPFRDRFFHALSGYRRVDAAGSHLNNIGSTPGAAYQGDWAAAKVEFQKSYKFSIAFENSSTPGYTTEKIVHTLAADTIPIYWGNPEVGREFNSRRFINCHEYGSMEEIIQRVIQVDQDDRLFEQIVNEPFFPGGGIPDYLKDASILAQFNHIFSQKKMDAFRRNRYVWGKKYEERRINEVRALMAFEGHGIVSKLHRALAKMGRPF